MKYIFTSITLILAACLWFATNRQSRPEVEKSPEPSDYMYAQRSFPYGTVPSAAYYDALESVQKHVADRGGSDITWESVGPDNVGGRVTDIAMHPSDQQTIYVATASGGVWKSVNQGDTWSPITDNLPSLSIGDIAVDPANKNVLWCGTGEPNGGGGSVTYDGRGIFKSTNAGATWANAGLPSSGSIGRIVVNPEKTDEVYVAAMGNLFGKNADRGVYKTSDGGQNWRKILFQNDSVGAIDLAIHPQNPDTVFAVTWERVRRQNMRRYGGPGCGIWRSFDGGENWTKLSVGLPATNIGRIGIALSEQDPNVLYAIYADQTGFFKGIFKTNNLGDTWSAVSGGDPQYSSFGWWFGQIYISPHDTREVYSMGINWMKTKNGGTAWAAPSPYLHADYHALYIHPQNSNLQVVGNDGGIYISKSGGAPDTWSHRPIPTTQFYSSEIDFQQPNIFAGGAQDNGTWLKNGTTAKDWITINGGDGCTVLIDPTNSNRIYSEYQYGAFSSSEGAVAPPGARFNWNTPFVLDPFDPNTLYLGAESVFKSTNRGLNWAKISPDLSNGVPGSGGVVYATLTSIAASSKDRNTLIAGTDDGNVWITKNGGGNWTKVSANLPKRWVTRVVTDPFDSNTFYVCFSGYRHFDNIAHVYKSVNNGTAWLDISGNLPDVPVNDLIVDPLNASNLYIATDVGVFQTQNGGANWEPANTGLPTVPVTDLTFHAPTRTLAAGTFGRSMFKTTLSAPTPVADIAQFEGVRIGPVPASDVVNGQFHLNSTQPVTITVFDQSGRLVYRENKGRLGAGKHEFHVDISVWVPGVYYCQLASGKDVLVRKLVKG